MRFRHRVVYVAAACAVATNVACAQTARYQTLHAFQGGVDGAWPEAGLTASGTLLYGTSDAGGGSKACANGCGTVFSLNPSSGAVKVLHAFRGTDTMEPSAGLLASGHRLYGTAFGNGTNGGAVFVTASGSGATKILHRFQDENTDGFNPAAGLLAAGGLLYGTTQHGGGPSGAVYSVDPKTDAARAYLDFPVNDDGFQPEAGLIRSGTAFYSTTYGGGTSGCGVLFSFNPTTGTATTAYDFKCQPDGTGPVGNLLGKQGILYGTTETGGTGDFGTVFAFNPATGAERVLYSFTGGNDGIYPNGALIVVGGKLYGTTYQGGAAHSGLIFSLDPVTGSETVLHTFAGGADGAHPAGGLTYVGGALYGTTVYGGGGPCANGCGTTFSITP